MKKLRIYIIPLFIFIILRLLFLTNFWNRIEYSIRDLLFLMRGEKEVSNDLVVLEIGDNTFNSLNQTWPFPRVFYASVIENLEMAGVKQIILDIEFTEQSTQEEDEILANVAARYDNIIFAGKHIKEKQHDFSKQQILPPIKEIVQEGHLWGTVNISLDSDGFVRRYQLFQEMAQENYYSIGILGLATLHGRELWQQDIENRKDFFRIRNKYIPKVSDKSCLLNFFGPSGTFKYYDFADVLDDSTFAMPNDFDLNTFELFLDNETFKDKIVLIGPTAAEFHDSHNTPFSIQNGELTPGVEIHANFIEMVLAESFLRVFPIPIYLLIFLIVSFLIFLMDIKLKPGLAIIINVILITGYLVCVYVMFSLEQLILPVLEIPLLLLFLYFTGLIVQYIRTYRERKFIKQAFKHYLAPELVNQLIKDPKRLEYGGTQRELSVLFADMRSFTSYAESHSPDETVSILHEYLTSMVKVIQDNKGTIDKFVGDSIIAIFGDPVMLDNHAYWACRAGFRMREEFLRLQKKWQDEKKDILEMGIGINSGIAIVGNLGSQQIFDYTAIGDTMNTGARIENLNKTYVTPMNIIISESTFRIAGTRIKAEYLDEVNLKGKTGKIKVYQLQDILAAYDYPALMKSDSTDESGELNPKEDHKES